MGLLALVLAGLAAWAIATGRLQRLSSKDMLIGGLALLGAVLTLKGKPLVGLPMLVGAALAWKRPQLGRRTPPDDADLASARALLGLPSGADEAAIRAAHKRLITRTHPDQGGTQGLAAQINAARDLLLADARRRRRTTERPPEQRGQDDA
jgi:hypothetical protein